MGHCRRRVFKTLLGRNNEEKATGDSVKSGRSYLGGNAKMCNFVATP